MIIDVLSLGHLTSSQDLLECILVQYGSAQLQAAASMYRLRISVRGELYT